MACRYAASHCSIIRGRRRRRRRACPSLEGACRSDKCSAVAAVHHVLTQHYTAAVCSTLYSLRPPPISALVTAREPRTQRLFLCGYDSACTGVPGPVGRSVTVHAGFLSGSKAT